MKYRVFVIGLLILGCGRAPSPSDQNLLAVGVEFDDLHNVYKLPNRELYSGSGPESERAFRALQQRGIKTIISVDGAKPDIQTAKRFGMRYVHLPIGYDGIAPDRAAQIAKAAESLPGPIYVHCHHGKHRGPAAVAVIMATLTPNWSVENAKLWMNAAGTDPKYAGLYDVRSVTKDALDACPVDFPEVANVPDFAKLMVEVDLHWDHLKSIQKAKWTVPADHPDLVPATVAIQLAEAYREAARLMSVVDRGPKFLAMLKDAELAADDLAKAIKTKSDPQPAFDRSQKSCSSCHTAFRDNPGK